ncbi:transcription initiation factor IIA large subunit-like [Rhodamnia argentea]|uniref:Transcription initiation factor IIA large subunit-like n=1 Tax=Rhodamnia argentea TaxID=178133 RepID=A0ABM3HXV1_9MYRT|nr:transcription initiation factor IIA large subunit-like [Rhodamnia argentea]
MLAHVGRPLSKIPQVDGQTPVPYDEMLSTPKIYNYQGVVNEDYNIASTPAPNDLQTPTLAIGVHNDVGDDEDEDEPPLNENDDDEDDVDEREEVTRTKSRWKCTLEDGIMHINNKDILFSKLMKDDVGRCCFGVPGLPEGLSSHLLLSRQRSLQSKLMLAPLFDPVTTTA